MCVMCVQSGRMGANVHITRPREITKKNWRLRDSSGLCVKRQTEIGHNDDNNNYFYYYYDDDEDNVDDDDGYSPLRVTLRRAVKSRMRCAKVRARQKHTTSASLPRLVSQCTGLVLY